MRYLVAVLAVAIAACDGNDATSATVPVAKTIEAVSGSGQIAVYRSTLPVPLVVKVKDQFGASFPGAVVTFAVTGTVILDRYTVTTNSSGNAQVVFGYGTRAGVDTVTATVSGVSTPALFIETGNPGVPQLFTIVSGNNQSVTAGTHLANDLVVRVTDVDGNILSNVPIVWTATTGTPTHTSNKSGTDGTAHLQFVPGAGANTISSFVDLTPLAVTFTATGN